MPATVENMQGRPVNECVDLIRQSCRSQAVFRAYNDSGGDSDVLQSGTEISPCNHSPALANVSVGADPKTHFHQIGMNIWRRRSMYQGSRAVLG